MMSDTEEGCAVEGPHYFLVLKVDEDRCTAVPLHSESSGPRRQLQESLKTGLADKWIGQESWYSPWQHWRIPLVSIAAASGDEESDSTNRRQYAADNPECLDAILRWETKNRYPYRPVT